MSKTTYKRNNLKAPQKKNKIFISWSKDNSKEFAKSLKDVLENIIFENQELECFVSDEDIASGADWWNKIKKELQECKMGIICLTKENLREPWIYYEAGAMIAKEVPSVPLLVSCNVNSLSNTPLKNNQAIDFYDLQKFLKMLNDINKNMGFGFSKNQVDQLGKSAYLKFKGENKTILNNIKNLGFFNNNYVYPKDITTIKRNTIFVSAPMSSIDDSEYNNLRNQLIEIYKSLQLIGFSEIHCPIVDIESPERFEGKTKAIKSNFPKLKQVDSMIVIYPCNIVSSSLVEIGYGIALTKKMVIFHREKLPYILDEAGGSIANVKTYQFSDYDEIIDIIKRNGMTLFEGVLDE